MIDDVSAELLSRHLDGDLDERERRELEGRLAEEATLRRELETMADLRRAVADLARREEPPAALDALVMPLRRSRPHLPRVRPAVRWLAAAATVLIGTTVALEVARQDRRPSPMQEPSARSTASGERFQLQPLPTRSGPEEGELLGAADHLLASPAPEVDAAPPEPLEVIGPLSVEPESADREQKRLLSPPPSERIAPPLIGEANDSRRRGAAKREVAPPSRFEEEARVLSAAGDQPAPAPAGAPVERHKAGALASKSSAAAAVPARGRLRIDAGGGRVTRGTFFVPEDIAHGVYPVEVEVVSGRVVAARVLTETASTDHMRVAEGLTGTTVAGAVDGIFSAEAVVD